MIRFLHIMLFVICSCSSDQQEKSKPIPPSFLIGSFEDDYSVSYTISDSLFEMEDHTKIHILEWNMEGQYFVGQNDSLNPYDPLLYSRIDWMQFEDMAPFEWGFCMSAYNEASLDSAKAVSSANRETPKIGCDGYPFSRMKRITN